MFVQVKKFTFFHYVQLLKYFTLQNNIAISYTNPQDLSLTTRFALLLPKDPESSSGLKSFRKTLEVLNPKLEC